MIKWTRRYSVYHENWLHEGLIFMVLGHTARQSPDSVELAATALA